MEKVGVLMDEGEGGGRGEALMKLFLLVRLAGNCQALLEVVAEDLSHIGMYQLRVCGLLHVNACVHGVCYLECYILNVISGVLYLECYLECYIRIAIFGLLF